MSDVRQKAFLSYNMKYEDGVGPDGRVDIGRQFDFIGDVETELMILNDGDESLCLGYHDVEFLDDIYVGDMVDFTAEMTKIGNSSRTCRIAAYKVATPAKYIDANAEESQMVYFDEPRLVTEGTVILVVRKELQRGHQPSGEVLDPWFDIEY